MPFGKKIYKSYRAETKAIDDKEGYIKAVVSTEAIDRDGEVILSKAWGNTLGEFMKHPVLLSSHDYNDLTKQLGEWVSLKVTEQGLEGIAKYYINKGNAEADWGYELAKNGNSAYSVGFMSKDFVEGGTTQSGKEPNRTYTDVELLEISQVSVPSNRESLVTMRSKGIDPIADEIANELLNSKEPVMSKDKYTTEEEAEVRAEEIGCVGSHSMDEDGNEIFMPCATHEEYDEIMNPSEEDPTPDSYGEQKLFTVTITEEEKDLLLKAATIINQNDEGDTEELMSTEEIVANAFKHLQNKNY